MDSGTSQNILVGVVSSAATALLTWVPAAIKAWRTDIEQEAVRARAAIEEAEKRAKLEQRIKDVETDLHQHAEAVRNRFSKLERKDQALEQAVTGKMPRFSGEGPTNGG